MFNQLKNLEQELSNKYDSQFEVAKISKIIGERYYQKINKMIYFQYCNDMFLFPPQYSLHIQKKYGEYEKEVKLYLAEAQVCLSIY